MKQSITKEQWGELSDEQKVKFAYDLKYFVEAYNLAQGFPNIDEMIEFLKKDYKIRVEQWNDEWGHWRVGLDWFNLEDFEFVVEKEELADALWEAVKYKLTNS